MKKKVLALVLTLAMLASLATPSAAAVGSKTYPDAVGHWAEESILRWSRCGLVKGDNLGNVNPDKPLRRCEMATILSDMLGLRTAAPISTFKDIDGSEWYARAILRCAAAGIMEGSNSMSYPEDHITREEAIVMFGRALGVARDDDPDLSKFSDGDEVSGWAAPYMATLTELGILSGMGDGTVAPHADINRAGAFTLMDKAISVYANAPGTYNSQNANGFVVINANSQQAGDVIVTGKATGVLVAVGATNAVKLRNLESDNVLVNGKTGLTVTGKSELATVSMNVKGDMVVESEATVDALSVNAEEVTVSNSGTVKTLSFDVSTTVTNSGTVDKLVADADATVTNTGTVNDLVVNQAIKVDNTKGVIKNAEINMGGVVMDGAPQTMTVADGVARPTSSTGRPITASGAVSSGGGGGGGGSSRPSKPTPGIKLDKTTAAVTEGETLTLKATVTLPSSDAIKGDVIWTSSDEEIASVDDSGKVTAVKAGTATITATVTVTIPDPTPSPSPSVSPSADPSESPSASPSVSPSTEPSEDPGESPSASPSVSPSTEPSEDPGESPSASPSVSPSADPSESPSASPSVSPSTEPSEDPGESPSVSPSEPAEGEGGDNTETGGEEELPPAAPAAVRAGTFAARADQTTTYKATCTITVKPVAVTGVSLSETDLTLEEGQTADLVATVTPENASNKKVTWTSDEESVAAVDDNGKVTAVTEGKATITVTTEDGNKTATCTVTVTGGGTPAIPSVTRVTVTPSTATIKVGKTQRLTANVTVENGAAQTVTWKSDNTDVATVDATTGEVTAVAEGNATITATSTFDSTKSGTCTVTVVPADSQDVPVESVTIGGKPTDPIKVGGTFTLTATVLPENATNKAVTWTSSDESKATVDAATGAVEALAAGEVTITATAGEKSDTYTFTVQPKDEEPPKDPSVTSVTVTPGTATIKVGATQQLTANVTVENGAAQTVTWESSDTSIATVDSEGLVTADATATGTVTIKAISTADTSKFGTCTVTVEKDVVEEPTYEISLDKESLDLVCNETYQLTATITPEDSGKKVVWSSDDETVATVSENGLVTAMPYTGEGDGAAVITATVEGAEVKAVCAVKVAQPMTLTVEVTKDGTTVGEAQETQTGMTVTLLNWLQLGLTDGQTAKITEVSTTSTQVLKPLDEVLERFLVRDLGVVTVTVEITTPASAEGGEATTETVTYTITLTQKDSTQEPGGEEDTTQTEPTE